ncbi:hypothetical protein AB1L30_23580 [Bremerella sp. JC817]|uniref:hypothetical protein n=1 Tax=Bremerella sp. JC817 TaxID=3231756 RepID=UPI00345779A0
MAFLKAIGGFIAGMVVAFVLVIAVEGYSAVVHPFPEDFDGSMEEVCLHVERYPAWVLATVIPMWGLLAFLGVKVANWIGNWGAAIPVALLLLVAVGFNQWMAPYPIWFEIGNFIVMPLAIWFALARRKPPVEAAE